MRPDIRQVLIHHDILRVKIGSLKVSDGDSGSFQLRSCHSIDGNALRCCNQNTHYDTSPREILQELARLLVIEYLACDVHVVIRSFQHTKKLSLIHISEPTRLG